MRYIDIPVGDYAPEVFNVVVEVPKGSQNKYEYDPELNLFKLERTLGSVLRYPGEYGFVPSSLAADGCPLDALVITESATFPGCIIEARAIGMFVMVDHGVEDLKLVCAHNGDPRFDWLTDYRKLSEHVQNEIRHFFRVYREIGGKQTLTQGWQSATQAKEILRAAIERLNARRGPRSR